MTAQVYIPRPRHLVLAFMAGLSYASGISARCYIEELVMELGRMRAET